MTRQEIIDELLSCARQSDDAAHANEVAVAAMRQEFDVAFENKIDPVAHKRVHELYTYVIQWPREAERLREEAELFRAAAEKLDELVSMPALILGADLHIPTLEFMLDYLKGERDCYAMDKFADINAAGEIVDCKDANQTWRDTMDELIEWTTNTVDVVKRRANDGTA